MEELPGILADGFAELRDFARPHNPPAGWGARENCAGARVSRRLGAPPGVPRGDRLLSASGTMGRATSGRFHERDEAGCGSDGGGGGGGLRAAAQQPDPDRGGWDDTVTLSNV